MDESARGSDYYFFGGLIVDDDSIRANERGLNGIAELVADNVGNFSARTEFHAWEMFHGEDSWDGVPVSWRVKACELVNWMIGSEAENPSCAYAWLDYIASPEANAQATEYFGEAPSNDAACEFRSEGQCELYHAGDEEYASQIWYWSTPIAECLDGRTDVECTDYAAWTSAWQEIKG